MVTHLKRTKPEDHRFLVIGKMDFKSLSYGRSEVKPGGDNGNIQGLQQSNEGLTVILTRSILIYLACECFQVTSGIFFSTINGQGGLALDLNADVRVKIK